MNINLLSTKTQGRELEYHRTANLTNNKVILKNNKYAILQEFQTNFK